MEQKEKVVEKKSTETDTGLKAKNSIKKQTKIGKKQHNNIKSVKKLSETDNDDEETHGRQNQQADSKVLAKKDLKGRQKKETLAAGKKKKEGAKGK